MRFEVEAIYNKNTLLRFQQILNSTIRKKRIQLVRILTSIVGIFSLGYCLLWIWAAVNLPEGKNAIVPAVSAFITGAAFLLMGIFYKKYMGRGGKRIKADTPASIRYNFDEKGFYTINGAKKERSSYNIIQMLCADDAYYVLMLGRNRGFLLERSRFTAGNPDEFASFLEKLTGKQFQYADKNKK